MGLFSGKKRTTIQASSSRLLDDKQFSYSSKQALSQWLWDNNTPKKPLTEYLIEGSQNALPKKFDKLYRFASKKERYIFGLPKASVAYEPENQILQEAKKYIHKHYTGEIVDIKLADSDVCYELWFFLKDRKDITSIELYLTDTDIDNTLPDFNLSVYDSDTNYAKVTYTFTTKHPKIMSLSKELTDDDFMIEQRQVTQLIDLSALYEEPKEGELIQPTYQTIYACIKQDNGYMGFRYEYKSGGIYEIDTALTATDAFGQYYPRLYIRLNQKDIVDSTDNSHKKDSTQAFKKIGLDIKTITQQLHKSIGGNYYDMQGLFIFMGIRINEVNDAICAEYLYRYFERLYKIAKGKAIAQFIEDNASSQSIEFESITLTEVTGVITKVNSFALTAKANLSVKGYYEHAFYYQKEDNSYIVITVSGLKSAVSVSGYTGVQHSSSKELVIPIDKSLLKQMTQKEREWLLYKSLHIQMMFVRVTKGKWYERGAFKAVVAVIGIVITVASAGVGASAGAIFKAVLISTVKNVIISHVLSMGLQLAIEKGLISIKTAGFIQFAVVIASMGKGANFDMSKILTAPNIMKAVNASFDVYNKQIQAKITEVNKKMTELNALQQTKQETLAQAQKLLDTKVFTPSQEMLASPMLKQDLFLTVDMFYHRHHNFDVVGLSHGLIEHFVEGTLANKQLPLNQTDDDVSLLLLV